MNVVGLILMGGKNSRMNGEKKALLKYKDKYFFECVSEAMQEAGVEKIYASVEKVWEQPMRLVQIVDEYAEIGPLGGIVTALKTFMIQEQTVDAVLVIPCDLPKISPVLLKELIQKYEETGLPTVLMSDGLPNPLVAIYTRECLPVLEGQIKEQNYRAAHWINQVEHTQINLHESDKYMILNVNSKEEYTALE